MPEVLTALPGEKGGSGCGDQWPLRWSDDLIKFTELKLLNLTNYTIIILGYKFIKEKSKFKI